jgi:hypothetical protein
MVTPRTCHLTGRPPKPKVLKPRPARGKRPNADEKKPPYERAEEEFRRVTEIRTETAIDGIEAWGRNALADGSIPETKRPALKSGLADLRFNFDQFKRLLEPLRDERADVFQDIHRRFFEIGAVPWQHCGRGRWCRVSKGIQTIRGKRRNQCRTDQLSKN